MSYTYTKSAKGWSVAGHEVESEHEAAALTSFLNGGNYDPDSVKELFERKEDAEVAKKRENDEKAAAEETERVRLSKLDPHEREAEEAKTGKRAKKAGEPDHGEDRDENPNEPSHKTAEGHDTKRGQAQGVGHQSKGQTGGAPGARPATARAKQHTKHSPRKHK